MCGLQSPWSQDSLSGLIKIDYAHCIQWLVDQVYPHADYVRIVQGNLNTHTAAALYEAFPAPEARRILQRVEFHYTRHPW
jgi:hypothetical protein